MKKFLTESVVPVLLAGALMTATVLMMLCAFWLAVILGPYKALVHDTILEPSALCAPERRKHGAGYLAMASGVWTLILLGLWWAFGSGHLALIAAGLFITPAAILLEWAAFMEYDEMELVPEEERELRLIHQLDLRSSQTSRPEPKWFSWRGPGQKPDWLPQ